MNFNKKIIKPTISPRLDKFLFHMVGYFDGKLNSFSRKNGTVLLVKAKDNFSPKILIVSPHFYKEKTTEYPIDNKKELSKIIKLKNASKEFFLIQNVSNNSSKVNSWEFSDKVPNALIILPETYLLGEQLANKEVLVIHTSATEQYFLTKINEVIYSARSNQLISNVERFTASMGGGGSTEYQLSIDEKAQVLVNSLASVSFLKTSVFINYIDVSRIKNLGLRLLIPMGGIVSLYLIAISAFLESKSSYLDNKLNDKNSTLVELLDLQTDLDKKLKYYQALNEFQKTRVNISSVWLVLAPLLDVAKVTNLSVNNNTVQIKGESKRATKVLEIIASNPNVVAAKFDTPVRKVNSTEHFNISFELTSQFIVSTKVGK